MVALLPAARIWATIQAILRRSSPSGTISSGRRGFLMEWRGSQEGCQLMSIRAWDQGASTTTETMIVKTGRGATGPTTRSATVRSAGAGGGPRPVGTFPGRGLKASAGHAHLLVVTGDVPARTPGAVCVVATAQDHRHEGITSATRASRVKSLRNLAKLLWGLGDAAGPG